MLRLSLDCSIRKTFSQSSYCAFKRIDRYLMTSVDTSPRVSILTEIDDKPGSLHNILRYFSKYDINLTHIESRPCRKTESGFHVFIDFEGRIGNLNTDNLINALRFHCRNTLILDEKEVPWFPRTIMDLQKIVNQTLDAGTVLESSHPGFHDLVYRSRREELIKITQSYHFGEVIPTITYTPEEIQTWNTIYMTLRYLYERYACQEYLSSIRQLEEVGIYGPHKIPQGREISAFLQERTGFQLYPVTGLLSARHFLNGLAFRVFFSTQYIRHSKEPFYTPEPDICHEFLGHVPMLADDDFADFSQEIGLASLGATDEEIDKLASCYWFSVEFGLVREGNTVKAYGAGLLSSFGELQYACYPSTKKKNQLSSTLDDSIVKLNGPPNKWNNDDDDTMEYHLKAPDDMTIKLVDIKNIVSNRNYSEKVHVSDIDMSTIEYETLLLPSLSSSSTTTPSIMKNDSCTTTTTTVQSQSQPSNTSSSSPSHSTDSNSDTDDGTQTHHHTSTITSDNIIERNTCNDKYTYHDSSMISPQYEAWNPNIASMTKYPITTYQPVYFVAESIIDAKKSMREYCENLPRPFYARYNVLTQQNK